MPKKKQETYEEIKQKLDDVVARLSDEKLTLSEMMQLYDEGNKYAAECQSILESYKSKIDEEDSNGETFEEEEG